MIGLIATALTAGAAATLAIKSPNVIGRRFIFDLAHPGLNSALFSCVCVDAGPKKEICGQSNGRRRDQDRLEIGPIALMAMDFNLSRDDCFPDSCCFPVSAHPSPTPCEWVMKSAHSLRGTCSAAMTEREQIRIT